MAENYISRDILGVPRRAAGRFGPFLRSGDAPGCPLPRVQFWLKTLQMAARTAQMQNAFWHFPVSSSAGLYSRVHKYQFSRGSDMVPRRMSRASLWLLYKILIIR